MESKIQVIFFDARDTLGEVDRPGHLIPYRPSTEQLLTACRDLGVKLGVITNLPGNPLANPGTPEHGLTDDQGKDMVVNAVLSQDQISQKQRTIGDFIPRDNVITNKAAKVSKPAAGIYEYAAQALNVPLSDCLFIGENQNEVIGALLAGMQAQRKQCPPGRDFAPALVSKVGESAVDSGRQFEAFFEHEHLLGERIFAIGEAIAAQLQELTKDQDPPLDQGKWVSPPKIVDFPENLRRAMTYFVHLIDHFADPVHLRAEEAMLEVAVACGMPRQEVQWVFNQHDQARAYWNVLDVAWRRIQTGDDDDRWYAMRDFAATAAAFVYLFKAHAVRENNRMYPKAGQLFDDSDDALVLNLISHFGPSDITPYVGMVEKAEHLLKLDVH
jgi:haloacid dehalogenase-like hydrolase